MDPPRASLTAAQVTARVGLVTRMSRICVLLLVMLASTSVMACFAPYGGPEYDALLSIEVLETSVPDQVKGVEPGGGVEMILAYSKATPGGIPIYDSFETLETFEEESRVVAEFSIEDRGELRPYITVMWWPPECCLCGAQANSKFLAL